MREVILYIAMSLDGYIASTDGDVAWLNGDGSDPENFGTYPAFYETTDTVVLGYNTYHQIVTELSPDKWPYADRKSYVITHRDEQSTENIVITDESPASLIERLKAEPGKAIWICGGAAIANALIDANLIDTYRISVVPTILGRGIPLFSDRKIEQQLRLVSSEANNGIVELNYTNRCENK